MKSNVSYDAKQQANCKERKSAMFTIDFNPKYDSNSDHDMRFTMQGPCSDALHDAIMELARRINTGQFPAPPRREMMMAADTVKE